MSLSESDKNLFVEFLAKGYGPRRAAVKVGVALSTIRSCAEREPEFEERCKDAVAMLNEDIEKRLVDKAMGGSINAIAMWLTNRDPQRWKSDKASRADTVIGGNVTVIGADVAAQLRDILTDAVTGPAAVERALETPIETTAR